MSIGKSQSSTLLQKRYCDHLMTSCQLHNGLLQNETFFPERSEICIAGVCSDEVQYTRVSAGVKLQAHFG